MPTFFNFNKRKGVFMIPAGATKSPTPAPPSFSNTKSLAFDGVDEYVSTSEVYSQLDGQTKMTFSAWIKPTSAITSVITSIEDNGSAEQFRVVFHSSRYIIVRTYTGSGRDTRTANSSIDLNVWTHIAFCLDYSLSSGSKGKIFINGVDATSTDAQNQASLNISGGALYIGARNISLGSLLPFNGNIDEVAIWSGTDLRNDVATIYNSGTPGDLSLLSTPPNQWYRNGDNSTYQTPQILMPENTNKNKVSNYSLNMDGVDDYIDIGNGISFNYNDAFTISTWVNVDAVSGTKAIYNKYDSSISGGRGIALNLFSSSGSGLNLIYFDLYSTNSGSTSTRKRITTRSTDFIISPDIWYLLTITYDGSGLGSGIKMYLNGVSKSVTITQDNLQSGDITNSLNAHFGATTTPSLFFNGTMDEVAIWDSALNSTQVTELYNGGESTTISGALAHWKMGEQATFSTNWTVPDQVGSNDGTSANMTIEDRVGDASNSSNNAVSFNMEAADIDNDTP